MQSAKLILSVLFENSFRLFRKYALKHKLKQESAHRIGLFTLMSIMLKYCYELGVKYVSVYAFSVDNFNRKPEEVELPMALIEEKIEELLMEESIVNTFGVRIHFIGNLKLLKNSTREAAARRAMAATAKNDNFVLLICVAYSSTDEIMNAIQKSYEDKLCKLQESDSGTDQEFAVTLSDVERHMYMSVTPEPDILIRTLVFT
ncbi:hypothetical protein MKW94_010875 [Papaver nudicaule]|uniref:Alkyl transferase n=1 Tax=Papaver nudicaule TaxID=74823 RepID=A0AA41RQQ9_PAPNU|nr:hypothetical protein [Papaver nudicaule]